MKSKSETGRFGENAVSDYLINLGYNVLSRNYRIKGGEIDIIAEKDGYIAFVEVKTRKKGALVSGLEAVNSRKKGLIIRTASDYCIKYGVKLQPRFDIAEVTVSDGKAFINYIKNAFDTTGYNIIF